MAKKRAAARTPPPPRRKKPPPKRTPGEDAVMAARADKALELRIAGATYRQIALQLAVSLKTAYLDVQTALGALDAVIATKAERLRDLETARLDRLTVALSAGIRAGLPGAIFAAVKIMERRAKLWGLDTPTPKDVTVTHRFPYAALTDAELKQKLIESAAAIAV